MPPETCLELKGSLSGLCEKFLGVAFCCLLISLPPVAQLASNNVTNMTFETTEKYEASPSSIVASVEYYSTPPKLTIKSSADSATAVPTEEFVTTTEPTKTSDGSPISLSKSKHWKVR